MIQRAMLRDYIIGAGMQRNWLQNLCEVLPFHGKHSTVIDNNYISAVSEAGGSKKPPSA